MSDTRFCFEIFRRALLHAAVLPGTAQTLSVLVGSAEPESSQGSSEAVPMYSDEAARTVLVQIYTDFIKAHINPEAARTTPSDDLVQHVWLRFWRSANKGLYFSSLEAALTYLKLTTVSTLIEDQRRERKRRRDTSLQHMIETDGEGALTDSRDNLFAQHTQNRFRARCREMLTDPLEYRIFWMRYGMALPPREIARILVSEGLLIKNRIATPRAVSDLLERSCMRLRRDPEIQELLRGD